MHSFVVRGLIYKLNNSHHFKGKQPIITSKESGSF